MSRIRFLLDENTPHAIRDQLLRRKPEMEVLVIGDDMAPALGTPDPELLRWIEREGYVLVSRNRRTLSQPRSNLTNGLAKTVAPLSETQPCILASLPHCICPGPCPQVRHRQCQTLLARNAAPRADARDPRLPVRTRRQAGPRSAP